MRNESKKDKIKRELADSYFALSGMKDRAMALKGIQKYLKDTPELTDRQKEEIKSFWKEHLGIEIPLDWHRLYYARSGVEDPAFVPDTVFEYDIRPHLNHPNFSIVYGNKAYLKRFIPNARTVRSVLINVNGHYMNEDFELIDRKTAGDILKEYPALVAKPALFTHHGEGVSLMKAPFDLDEIEKTYTRNYVMQIPIEQHRVLSSLSLTSVNTLRVVTVLLEGRAHVTSTYIKTGAAGEFANNVGDDRYFIGVDENGVIADYAADCFYNKHDSIPNSVDFRGMTLPGYDAMCRCAEKAHEDIAFFGMVGFDMCIDKDEQPVVVEANLKQPGITHQLAAGPYFGKYTAEVLEYCKKRNITKEVGWPQMW